MGGQCDALVVVVVWSGADVLVEKGVGGFLMWTLYSRLQPSEIGKDRRCVIVANHKCRGCKGPALRGAVSLLKLGGTCWVPGIDRHSHLSRTRGGSCHS